MLIEGSGDEKRQPDVVLDNGNIKLYCGDCLEILPTLEAGSVDACVTDPPYGMAYQSARRTDKEDRFEQIAGDDAPFVWFLPFAYAACAAPSCLVCFCRWDSAESFRNAIGWANFDIAGQCVWDRQHHGMGDLKGSPAPMHDTIWIARKGKWKFHDRRGKSVLHASRLGGSQLVHPTEKPVELMTEIVNTYASPEAVVLDPFMGSGTTGVACVKTGRKFIGIELDRGYFDIAVKRIEKAIAERDQCSTQISTTTKSGTTKIGPTTKRSTRKPSSATPATQST